MKKVIVAILIISISLSALVISLEINAYGKDYYIKKYEENNIAEVTGKDIGELGLITDDLILYLKGGGNDLLKPQFNKREVMHMEDVRNLFHIARLIKYIGIIAILLSFFYFTKKRKLIDLAKAIFYGLFINHILLIIISILAYNDFNKYFTYFHLIFFSNDLWLLDPRTDLMIQMLPENFFSGMALNIVVSFLIILSSLQVLSFFYIRKNRLDSIKR